MTVLFYSPSNEDGSCTFGGDLHLTNYDAFWIFEVTGIVTDGCAGEVDIDEARKKIKFGLDHTFEGTKCREHLVQLRASSTTEPVTTTSIWLRYLERTCRNTTTCTVHCAGLR